MWQRRYAGDPGVVGRTIVVDGHPHTVIGVMPREFNFPFGGVRGWVPLDARVGGAAREVRPHLLFGVLADGWTRERAETELDAIHASLAAEYPDAEGESAGIALVGMREALNFGWYILRPVSLAMGAAVALLLLIACANIAGLGLARAEVRRHEIAVRGALGASSFRVIRQVIVEMLVLATLGGILGLVLARGGLQGLNAVMPEDLFRVGEFGVDSGALLFVTAVVLVAAIAAGIAPALLAARSNAGAVLRADQRTAGSVRAGRLRRVLVMTQVAVALVLVVCAGLTARSLQGARDVSLGFEPDGVLTVELTLPETTYADAAAVRDLYQRYLAALRELPVVRAAGTQTAIPLNHENPSIEIGIEGVAMARDERPRAWFFRISPGYVEAIGTRLLEGRAFTELDGPDGERVALVNRTFAQRLLDGDAIGRVIVPGQGTPHRVVGVIDDVLHTDIGAPAGPQVYLPASQGSPRRQFVVVRTAGEPAAAVPAVRSVLAAIDADLPAAFMPMSDVVGIAVMPWSMMAAASVVFGVFALLLGAIGLYGVIAFSVERRRRELGVRLALGADRGTLLRLVVGEGLRLAGIGIAIGLAGAFGAGRLLASLLFGVRPEDPVTLAGATLVLLVVAVLATLVPARRALRADPLEVLRSG